MKGTILTYSDVFKVRNITILTVVTFFYSLTFYTTTFTLFLRERGLDYWEIFILESILSAAIFLFEVPSGYLADRIGRKKVIIFSVFCYALSVWLTAVSYSFWLFALESAIFGIGVAAMSGADSALIYDSLRKREKEHLADYAFSLTGGAVTTSMVFSLPIGGWLSTFSLNVPVYVTSISLLIAVVVAFGLQEDQRSNSVLNEKRPMRLLHHFATLFKENQKLVYLQFFSSFSFTFVFGLMYLNQPLFLSYGVGLAYFGLIMLGSNVINTLVLLFSPILSRKLGSTTVLFAGTLMPGMLFIMLWHTSSALFGILLLVAILAFDALKQPIYRTFLNDRIGDKNRATILSIISFAGSLIGMAVKPIVGLLADQSLSLYLFISGLALIGASIGMLFTIFSLVSNGKVSGNE